MKKKIVTIVTAILLILLVSIGSIILANKLSNHKSKPERNFIIASPSGLVDYPFPLAFERGISAQDLASHFAHHINKLQRKQGTRFITIDPTQKIYSDILIKIS